MQNPATTRKPAQTQTSKISAWTIAAAVRIAATAAKARMCPARRIRVWIQTLPSTKPR